MLFYHGTSTKAWEEIQQEGVLWGKHSYRYTYLSPCINVAKHFGDDVLLEVEYTPIGVNGEGIDNYCFDEPKDGAFCWQFSVFKPIPINNVKRIELDGQCKNCPLCKI